MSGLKFLPSHVGFSRFDFQPYGMICESNSQGVLNRDIKDAKHRCKEGYNIPGVRLTMALRILKPY